MPKQNQNEELSDFEKWQLSEIENSRNHWFNKSSDLHASAGVLWLTSDNNEEMRSRLQYSKGFSFSVACYPSYKLLMALSIELLIKAIIVAKGKKTKPIHNLVKLANQAELKISNEENVLFDLLSEIIYWEGKYPVPNTPSSLFKQWERWKTVFKRQQPGSNNSGEVNIEELIEWENMHKLWEKFAKELFDLKK